MYSINCLKGSIHTIVSLRPLFSFSSSWSGFYLTSTKVGTYRNNCMKVKMFFTVSG